MTVFNQLLTASFRSVSFLVPDESKSAGKKTVAHEYPGSDRRFVEELGTLVGVHTITAIIHGADAIQGRLNLEKVLIDSGRGLLTHPSLGQLMVVATDFTSRSSDRDVGQFIFNITFKESADNITLSPAVSSKQSVSTVAGKTVANLDASFVNRYVNTSFTDILKTNTAQVREVLDLVDVSFKDIEGISETALSILQRTLGVTNNQVSILVNDGGDLVSELRTVYNQTQDLSPDVQSLYSGWVDMSNYNVDRVPKSLITAKRITEEVNLAAIDDHTRLNGLAFSYESAVYRDYKTDEELASVQGDLEDKYNSLIEEAPDDSLAYDPDFRSSINELRVSSRDVFEEKEQNVWKVVDIEAGESSMALTSHRFYGNFDKLQTLTDLNKDTSAALSEGTLKGLT